LTSEKAPGYTESCFSHLRNNLEQGVGIMKKQRTFETQQELEKAVQDGDPEAKLEILEDGKVVVATGGKARANAFGCSCRMAAASMREGEGS
jgi:hypothetical protein